MARRPRRPAREIKRTTLVDLHIRLDTLRLAGCSDRLQRKVVSTMLALIIDLFQNGPPHAVAGFVLFTAFAASGLGCLAIGAFQHATKGNGRTRRRRARR